MSPTSADSGMQKTGVLKYKKRIPSDPILQMAFENSLQANIISVVRTGKIIRVNKAACKLLGYSKKELLTRKRAHIFLISDENYKAMILQRIAEGSAKADLSIIRKSGKLRPCEITSVIFKDTDGVNKSVTTIVDRTDRLSEQKKIDDHSQADNNDWIRSIAKTTYDVTWDWDMATNIFSFGKSYEKVFGYKLLKPKLSLEEWLDLFQAKESAIIKTSISKAIESDKKTWIDNWYFTCPDGTPAHVIVRSNIVRDNDGTAIRMIGVIHDVSKMQALEEILDREIRIKKSQISEAVDEAKETERSDIGKELHDNVNQLLGASMLYLDMARKDVANGEIYLIHSSEYTFSAIEEIRRLTKRLVTDTIKDFGLCGAIRQAARDTMLAHPVKIHIEISDTVEKMMGDKCKLNAFRIFQEQLNNILKHSSASDINIKVSDTGPGVVLSIADNGIGFDHSMMAKREGIGIRNIISRAESFKGKAKFVSAPGKGCTLVVSFPITRIDT